MGKLDSVLGKVLKRVTPTEREKRETENAIQMVSQAVEDVIKPMGLSFTIAGSYMRDTWMPDKKEFDVFILFPEKTPREDLEKRGLQIGKKVVNKLKGHYEIAYAEHPYVRARINLEKAIYDIDIVPCFAVRSAQEIKSAVDRTPFHNEWLLYRIEPKHVPEVRLLKQFLKAQGLYGSDAKTLGFSGYLCELLIVTHKTFKNLLKETTDWVPGKVVLNPGGFDLPPPSELTKKYRDQPLIVIDPVDPNRNVSASLSPEKFSRFLRASREVLKRPSESLFRIEKPRISLQKLSRSLKSRGTKPILILFKRPKVIDDILWPQLRRAGSRLSDILEEYEFKVLGTLAWSNGESLILLEMEVWELPEIRKIKGPPVFIENRSQEFLKKYKPLGKVSVEKNYWTAQIKRRFRTPEAKLRDTLSDSLKELKAKGIPSYIAMSLTKGHKILGEGEIIKLAGKYPDFGRELLDYLEKE